MTAVGPLTLPFSEIRAADLALVGGKGANLGELAHAGLPVPPGFCLTTVAFREFISACPHSAELYDLLDSLVIPDVEAVRSLAEHVRDVLLRVPVPLEVADSVKESWHELGADRAYAVRSSATAEDLPDASFAGQQETYLNVIGERALLDAVRRCWVSLFTDRAILYRLQNGFPHREVELSVVVQRMIVPQTSGIMFTADPLTGHRRTLTIDASFGLGEAIVGGLVTPDAYEVDKRTLTIAGRKITDKVLAIVPAEGGGTRQEPLSPARRRAAALTDAQVLDLAELGTTVEAHYARPQDLEWAVAEGRIYLLQTRPITSLYPIDGLGSPDDSLHIFFSLGHQQSMTDVMAPLSMSSIQVLMPVGHKEDAFGNSYIRASGGRLFADITVPLRHPVMRRAVLGLLSQLDVLAPESVKRVMRHAEFRRPSGLRLKASGIKSVLTVVRRVFSALFSRDLTGFVGRTNALIEDYLAGVGTTLEALPPGRQQLQGVTEVLRGIAPFFLNWAPEAGAGIAATRILTRLARHRLTPDEVESLTLGVPGNVVNEMNLAIGDLADVARESPMLRELFERLGDDGNAVLARAAQLEDSAAFMAAWEAFVSRYGARGPSEIDIRNPRWREDPLPVLRIVGEFLKGDGGRHRAHLASIVQERDAAMQRLRGAAGAGPLGRVRLRLLERLYYVMTEVGGMREHHKYVAVRVLAAVKEILEQEAVQLVAADKLARTADIWFLTWGELISIWDEDAPDRGASIARRRAELAGFERLMPPLIVTSDGEAPVLQMHVEDAPEGALLGSAVSRGVVEGTVHVIRDPQRESLAPGEILVARFTDPGWTPLFINAGGLIMEVGGALTHGAVVAREYGIPAIVGVREATQTLRTGQRVRVDGDRGIIEVIGDA